MDRLFSALRATLPSPDQLRETFRDTEGSPEEITRRALGWLPAGAERTLAYMPVPGAGTSLGETIRSLSGAAALNRVGQREVLQPLAGGLMAGRDAQARLIEAGIRGASSVLPETLRPLAEAPARAAAAPLTVGANPDAEIPELSRAALAEYGREQAGRAPMGEFIFETATDPTTYIPFGRLGTAAQVGGKALQARGPGLRALGAGLEGLGKATSGWQTLTDRAGPEMLKGVGTVVQEIPGVGKLFQRSALSAAAQETGETGAAFLAGARDEAGNLLTAKEAMRPGALRAARGSAVWRQTGNELSSFEDDLTDLPQWQQQATGLRIYGEVQARKNALEVETSRRIAEATRAMGLPAGAADLITPQEGQALINQAWRDQANGTLAAVRAGRSALEKLKGQSFPTVPGVDEAAVRRSVADAVTEIRNASGEARDMAMKLEGKGPFAGQGVFEGAPDPTEIEPFLDAQDRAYRTARQAIMGALDQTIERVVAGLGGQTDQMSEDMMRAGLEFYRAEAGDLAELGKPLHQRAVGASAAQRQKLETQALGLNAAYDQIERDQDYVTATAAPLIRAWLRAGGGAAGPGVQTADTLAEQTMALMRDTTTLKQTLGDMERAGQLSAQARKQITDRLDRYAGVGDLMDDRHGFNLMFHEFGKREAIAKGEKPPSAMLGAYFAATGVWRDTALLSPRFHLNNMIWMLWSADRMGYAAAPIAAAYLKNMANVAKQVFSHERVAQREVGSPADFGRAVGDIVRAVVEEPNIVIETSTATAPHLAALGMRDAAGNLVTDQRIAMQTASGVSIAGPGQNRSALAGKNAPSAAAGALLTGGVGYALPADSEEERLKRAAIGAGIGGAAGGALPTLIWANRLLGQVVERAGRQEIFSQGVARAMAGKGDEFLKVIDANRVVTQETIQRRITRRGQEVQGIAGLLGSGFTMPGAGPGGGTLFGPAAPGADRLASQVGPGGLTIEMGEPAVLLERAAPDAAVDAVKAWVKERGDYFDPQGLRAEALRVGYPVELADELADEWAGQVQRAADFGVGESNAVNFDYGDVSNLTEAMRKSGLFPFATFTVKALPNVVTWMIQDPRLFIAIDRLNNLSDDDIAEAGLSPKFARLAKMGILGEWAAGLFLGRSDAELMGQPWSMFIPYAEVGRPPRPAPGNEEQQPLERALDFAGQFGASLGPVPQLVGRLTGWTPDLGSSLLRTSPYIEAATTFAGQEAGLERAAINPEAPVQGLIRGVRTALTGEPTPTVTGEPLKDYAIRQRIAETALAKTGKAPTGEYKKAMDDPKSAIWRQAQREVERQRAGQTVAAATIPFRTKALTDMEQVAADAQRREKLTRADQEVLTEKERAARINAAYKRGSPAVALWSLGGSPEQIGNRQYDDYLKQQQRWKRMDPKRRAAAQKDYLKDKPYLAAKLAAFPAF